MTTLSRREIRHAQTKQEIINAAFELVITKGPDKLSLREVARNVGYKSPAGLYEYFDGKDGLIEAVCFEADNRFLQHLSAVDNTLPTRDYLIELGMAYIQFARQHPEQFQFLFDNQTTQADEKMMQEVIESDTDNAFTLVYHAIERALDEKLLKLIDDITVFEMTYCLWAITHGCATLQNRHLIEFPVDFERVDRLAIIGLLRGFGLDRD